MTFNDICLFDAQTHPSSACWYVHDFMLHGARFAFISIHKSVMWSRVKGNCRIFSAAAGSHNLKTVQQSCIRVKWCRSGVPIKSRWYQGLLRVPFPLANLSRVLLISNPLAFQPKWASMPQTPTYTYIYISYYIIYIILYISYYIYHIIYIILYIYYTEITNNNYWRANTIYFHLWKFWQPIFYQSCKSIWGSLLNASFPIACKTDDLVLFRNGAVLSRSPSSRQHQHQARQKNFQGHPPGIVT